MLNTIVGTGAVGGGAVSRYGSISDQKMRLLAAPARQHWVLVLQEIVVFLKVSFYMILEILDAFWKSTLLKRSRKFPIYGSLGNFHGLLNSVRYSSNFAR
jgi:hypothetical protein